jgi:hypothetical protein
MIEIHFAFPASFFLEGDSHPRRRPFFYLCSSPLRRCICCLPCVAVRHQSGLGKELQRTAGGHYSDNEC